MLTVWVLIQTTRVKVADTIVSKCEGGWCSYSVMWGCCNCNEVVIGQRPIQAPNSRMASSNRTHSYMMIGHWYHWDARAKMVMAIWAMLGWVLRKVMCQKYIYSVCLESSQVTKKYCLLYPGVFSPWPLSISYFTYPFALQHLVPIFIIFDDTLVDTQVTFECFADFHNRPLQGIPSLCWRHYPPKQRSPLWRFNLLKPRPRNSLPRRAPAQYMQYRVRSDVFFYQDAALYNLGLQVAAREVFINLLLLRATLK
eukprot:284819617_2